MKIERTWYAADKTGFHMLHALYQTSLKYRAVTMYNEWFVTRLLVDDGRCQGVTAVERLRSYGQTLFQLDRHLDRWEKTIAAAEKYNDHVDS